MAKRLQELSLLNGTPRPQARLLIKDNPTGFLEDYSISVNDFKSDLIFSNEVSTAPVIGQIPRLVNSNGVPALPAVSARNLLHIAASVPTGNGTTLGLLRLTDSTTSTSSLGGGFAVTPLALRNVNLAKPNISGATITGNWNFNADVVFNSSFTATAQVTVREIIVQGNIVSPDSLTVATTTGNIILAPTNTGSLVTTFTAAGNIIVPGNVIVNTAPTLGTHLTNKSYVDSLNFSTDNNLVHKSGDETISGNKTFTRPLSVHTDRVALELKATDTVASVITDFGTISSDFVTRKEVMLPTHADYGAIKYTFATDVPNANRQMYIGNHKVYHSGNDGSDSGLDADLLDGKQSGLYVQTDEVQTITAQKTFNAQTNFNSTVNFNTQQINLIDEGLDSIPRLVINGTTNTNGHIGYIQFENRNGGEVGNPLTTVARLLVNSNFDLNWNGYRVLTAKDEGAGNGIDADTVDGIHASSFVTTTGTQNVNGNKTFGNKVTINNSIQSNKQFEITGATPSINLSPNGAVNHYRLQVSDNGNFDIVSDTDGNENFNTVVLGVDRVNEQVYSHNKQLLNAVDDFSVGGSFTFDSTKRINFNTANHFIGTNAATGSPILSSTGALTLIANSNDSVDNQPVVIRSGTDGLQCVLTDSVFTVRTEQPTMMANFFYGGVNGGSVIRFTGRRNPESSDILAQLQSFNNETSEATSLLFRANDLLEYTGRGFRAGFVDCNTVSLSNINGNNIPLAGDFGYVSNFRSSVANGDASVLWGTDGGGLLIRGEDGLAGVIDSKNMVHIAPTFRGLNVNTGGFNVNSLANFNAGNRNYITTRNINDAAVNLSDSDIVNVNGLHFSSGSSGLTFFKGGLPHLASSYSSLLIDNIGIRYRSNSASENNMYCAMLSRDTGISYWSITTPNDETFVRTPELGILPFAPTNDARNNSSLGTQSWTFAQAHINDIFCYGNVVLGNSNTTIITPQYTGVNEIFMKVRGRASLSVGGLVNSEYNFQVDSSGSGVRLQTTVTPTGAIGNDNMFSVRASDGKPKLYVGSQRTGTQNSNFYVGVANNGSGGRRVIHEGDGGRLLTSEAII